MNSIMGSITGGIRQESEKRPPLPMRVELVQMTNARRSAARVDPSRKTTAEGSEMHFATHHDLLAPPGP